MKNKVKNLIRILGVGLNELVIDIKIDDITFDTIEWNSESNLILLHHFVEDLDFEYDFDELEEEQQLIVFKHLSIIYN